MPDPYAEAAEALRSASAITLTTHINPDADGLGAGLALLLALDKLGKPVRFLCPSKPASIYAFLPGFTRIQAVIGKAEAEALPAADLMLSCDCGDRERLGDVLTVKRRLLLNLDHHASNTRFGDLNLVDEVAEASGVVARRLLQRLGSPLDREQAECLYAALVFDTGRFMHSNTTPHTFRFAAELMETGIDAAAINRRLTYTRSAKDLALQRLAIEHLAVDADPRLAGIALPASAIETVGEPEDWGDLVEIPRSLAGVEVAYLMRERKAKTGGNEVRVSLRSNPPFRVEPVARRFGGGGHHQAAGCTVPGTLAEAQQAVLPLLRLSLTA